MIGTKRMASVNAFRRLAASLLLVVFVSFITTGCLVDVSPAVAAIDRAIAALNKNSEDWQNILNRLIGEIEGFDQELQDKLLPDVQNLLTATIAASGEEFRCDTDFLGSRVAENLARIRAKLLKDDLPPLEPRFCSTTPWDHIDLRNPPDAVAISGYNFNDNPPIRVFARSRSAPNNLIDLTPRIARSAHYHLSLPLSPNYGGDGFVLNNDIDRLIFKLKPQDEHPLYELPVIPKTCRPATRRVEAGRHLYLRPDWKKNSPLDDRDFYGEVDIKIVTTLNYGGSGPITAWVKMTAEEPGEGLYDTSAEGTAEGSVYEVPHGMQLVGVGAPGMEVFGPHTFGEDDPPGPKEYPGAQGIVRTYKIQGDRNGDDAGIYTDLDVLFREFEVQLIENEDCIPQ